MEFHDTSISYFGPNSSGKMNWEVFIDAIPTERGMFLRPDKGIVLHVPDTALSPTNSKATIVDKIKKINAI